MLVVTEPRTFRKPKAQQKKHKRRRAAPIMSLQSSGLLHIRRMARSMAPPSSIPTDCSAIVATTIRLLAYLGIVSDAYEALTGKSMPIPIPTNTWPSTPAAVHRPRR